MNRNITILIVIFVIVVAFRLYFAFNADFSYDAFYELRQIENVKETGTPLYDDPLSYGGREHVVFPFYYYIMAFLIKVPIPLLVFLMALPAFYIWTHKTDWYTCICLTLPVLIIVSIFSCLQKVNVGIRYILPVFPFTAANKERKYSNQCQNRHVPEYHKPFSLFGSGQFETIPIHLTTNLAKRKGGLLDFFAH